MVRTGQAVKNKTYSTATVVIKPKIGRVYRTTLANRKDAELCVYMHEAAGERAFILENGG